MQTRRRPPHCNRLSQTARESFRQFSLVGDSERVAPAPGRSVNAVILAKSPVLKRLRAEAGEILWQIRIFATGLLRNRPYILFTDRRP